MKSLWMFLLFLPVNSTQATFYDRKAEGWHWYENLLRRSIVKENTSKRDDLRPDSTDEKVLREEEKAQERLKSQDDPLLRMETFKRDVERLKAIAILNPTFANVRDYMEIQKEVMERSTRFAQKWMEVVYTTPKLDYTLRHPTSQAARHVYLDEKRAQMEKDVRALSQRYGLFFFYSSKCAYCKSFAPIVKSFSEKYGWEVLAISLDGSFLPEFPESRVDNGTAKSLGVQFVPTLLAVDPKSAKVIPLSNGMSTHDQIEDRIRVLIIKRNEL